MRPAIHEIPLQLSPEALVARLHGEPGIVLLRSKLFDFPQARYSLVTARPFLALRSFGSRCELAHDGITHTQYGNPWHILDGLMARYELLEELDLPFPLGGCFGYWGYDLKNFVEPRLPRRAVNDLELPDCHVGFYPSLVVFDHRLDKSWIVATGLQIDGSRSETEAAAQLEFWRGIIHADPERPRELERGRPARSGDFVREGSENSAAPSLAEPLRPGGPRPEAGPSSTWSPSFSRLDAPPAEAGTPNQDPPREHATAITSNFSRDELIARIETAQRYIHAGDIYQVNLAQRLSAPCPWGGWEFFERLAAASPAPFSAYFDCGDFQLASSSPEMFLRLSGSHILTRPIKGTRPRDNDPNRDARFTYELQTSAKEMAELVMITDLLRNDLGRVCEYGSVQVPELVRLERYPQVQHLVSTVEGRLRADVTHFAALAACFPGGSITGAPKIRAMEIIDELEPIARGPYTGCHGYLGFNRESQLAITIRTAVCKDGRAWFHAGAGIVADSIPAAEYDETLAKARGFLAALNLPLPAELPRATPVEI